MHTFQLASSTLIVSILFGLVGCSASTNSHDASLHKRGMPGQSLDAVVKNIHEQTNGEDTMGTHTHTTFQVFMTSLPDETGQLSDEGLVTLNGAPS